MEGCGNTLGCINCHGGRSAAFRRCPEMPVHARAHVLRSGSYIPFSVALQRARVELLGGPVLPEPIVGTGRRGGGCYAIGEKRESRPDGRTLNPSLTGAGLSTEPRPPINP